jgi:hypothetical protein
MNENFELIEIKRNDLDSDAPIDKVFHWLFINKELNKIEKLIFKNMGEEIVNENKINIRTFENSELRFDEAFAKFQIQENGHILMKEDSSKVSTIATENIRIFLND